jgi:hypothetical protein
VSVQYVMPKENVHNGSIIIIIIIVVIIPKDVQNNCIQVSMKLKAKVTSFYSLFQHISYCSAIISHLLIYSFAHVCVHCVCVCVCVCVCIYIYINFDLTIGYCRGEGKETHPGASLTLNLLTSSIGQSPSNARNANVYSSVTSIWQR